MKNTTKTNRSFIIALTVLMLSVCVNVNAQSVPKSKYRFGIGVDGLLPVGDASKNTNFVLGITPRLQYGITDNVALTLTSGLYHFFSKTVTYPASGSYPTLTIKDDADMIPVKIGVKVFIASNVYLGAETGAGFALKNGIDGVNFIASPAIGYATKKWDVGFRYENFTNGSSAGLVGMRVAYGFGL